jgi:hypothetical protein
MLRADTQNLSFSTRARLLVKYAMFPGTNWVSRDKSKVGRMFLISGAALFPSRGTAIDRAMFST